MITPVIIKILYVLGLVIVVLAGLAGIINGINNSYYGGAEKILGGILLIIFGPLLIRVYAEIVLLAFKINQTLTEIRNTMPNNEIKKVSHQEGPESENFSNVDTSPEKKAVEKIYCAKCGAENKTGNDYCRNCGANLKI